MDHEGEMNIMSATYGGSGASGHSQGSEKQLKLVGSGNGATEDRVGGVEKKIVKYRECQKNHAASIGGHAIDGCGEFMPSGEDGTLEALKCAACECHRNFHRREADGDPFCECCRRKRAGLPPAMVLPHSVALPPSRSPAPMMMALAPPAPGSDSDDPDLAPYNLSGPSVLKKRFRTKFSSDQKEKMFAFADKLGWKIQKHDESEVQQFCADVGVKRHVLKVWMHNNKNTFELLLPIGVALPDLTSIIL